MTLWWRYLLGICGNLNPLKKAMEYPDRAKAVKAALFLRRRGYTGAESVLSRALAEIVAELRTEVQGVTNSSSESKLKHIDKLIRMANKIMRVCHPNEELRLELLQLQDNLDTTYIETSYQEYGAMCGSDACYDDGGGRNMDWRPAKLDF